MCHAFSHALMVLRLSERLLADESGRDDTLFLPRDDVLRRSNTPNDGSYSESISLDFHFDLSGPDTSARQPAPLLYFAHRSYSYNGDHVFAVCFPPIFDPFAARPTSKLRFREQSRSLRFLAAHECQCWDQVMPCST